MVLGPISFERLSTVHQADRCVFDHPPTSQAMMCARRGVTFQEEMYGEKPAKETGTVRALINAYQTDMDSPYHASRYQVAEISIFISDTSTLPMAPFKLEFFGARDSSAGMTGTPWRWQQRQG